MSKEDKQREDNTSSKWTIERSMANLFACNAAAARDAFSTDILKPTVKGGIADLAAALKSRKDKK